MLRRFLSLPFTVRLAIIAWVAVVLGITLRVAIAPAWKGTVVNIYILAAERWWASENIYLWQPGIDLYRNPPGVTPLLTPLTWLPAKLAGILWRLGSTAVFLLALRYWLRSAWSLTRSQTALVFLLTLPLALASLNNGQLNLLLIGVLLLGSDAAVRGQTRRGAVGLACAAGLKVYPAAVGMLLAVARPRRVLPVFALGILGFALLPFLFQRSEYVIEMHRTLAFSMENDIRSYDDANRAPQDLFLNLHALGLDPGRRVYRVTQLAAAIGMALLMLRASRRGESSRSLAILSFHLGCLWMTVLGPASEGPTYTILGPTAAILLVEAYSQRTEPGGRARFTLAILGYGLLVSPIVRDAFPHGAAYRALGPFPAGGCLLLVLVVWNTLRSPAIESISLFEAKLRTLPSRESTIAPCRSSNAVP